MLNPKTKIITSLLLGLNLLIFQPTSVAAADINSSYEKLFNNRKSSIFSGALCALAVFSSPQTATAIEIPQKRYNPNQETIKILTVDGGGTHGTVPLTVMNELERQTGKPIHELFDVVGGTSIGSILTTFLTSPKDITKSKWEAYSTNDILGIMYSQGPNLFAKRNALAYPSIYDSGPLEGFCSEVLRDAKSCHSMIPRASFVFDRKAFDEKMITSEDEEIFKATDVVLSSSALPIALPNRQVSPIGYAGTQPKYSFSDGGLLENDPETATIGFARSIFPKAREIILISLGDSVGKNYKDVTARKKIKILNMIGHAFFNAAIISYGGTTNPDLQKVLGKNYVRFDPTIDKDISLTDGRLESLKYMNEQTLEYIEQNKEQFNSILKLLAKKRSQDADSCD